MPALWSPKAEGNDVVNTVNAGEHKAKICPLWMFPKMVITPKYLFSKESEGGTGNPFLQQQSAVWRSSSWITKISEKWQLSDYGRRDWFDCRNHVFLVKCHVFEGILKYSSYCGFFEPSHLIPLSWPLVRFFCAHLALSRPQLRRLKEWVRRKRKRHETRRNGNPKEPWCTLVLYIYIYCVYIYDI